MAQVILDEQLRRRLVLLPIRAWITAERVQDLRPHEVIKDDRIPTILCDLNQPTFVPIDIGFWDRRLCDRRYCILYFAVTDAKQGEIPAMLRRLLRLPDFRTKAVRMGVVARVSSAHIDLWHVGGTEMRRVDWPA